MEEWASQWASCLSPGDLVILDGPLGSGKTHFVRGLIHHFLPHELVTSPSYSLIIEYSSSVCTLYHMDFYRLSSQVFEEELIGAQEIIHEGKSIVFVEWGQRLRSLAHYFVSICIDPLDTARIVTIEEL